MQGYISYVIDELSYGYCAEGERLINPDTHFTDDNADIYCMFYSMAKNIQIYNLHDYVLHRMNSVDAQALLQIINYKVDMSKIKETIEHIFNK